MVRAMRFGQKPPDHPSVTPDKIGVLLLNLGTPDSPDYWPMRRYLSEFLSDRRVIETNPLLWQLILQGIILNVRPQKSGANYRKIWDNEAGDSPLRVITRRQVAKLQAALGDKVIVDFGMRYGNPSTEAALKALMAKGCYRILVCPLYPQYSATTTATANEAVFNALRRMRWQPAIRTLPPYYDDPAYIEALKTSIEQALGALSFSPDAIIASFHGMPRRTLERGDPYHCHCQKTARLLSKALDRELIVSFQSRFGRAKWLEPATDTTLASLPGKGVKRIAIVAPGFSADCLETLEELAIRGRETFLAAGGSDFAYLPCLNADASGMEMLHHLLQRELAGWIGPS